MEFHDWRLEVVDSFMHLLESNIKIASGTDHMRWLLNHNGNFSVRS
jgi:hypothetical protein